jgi:C-methyltransferase-like protein/methyltransferase family protein/putative zinc binding protein
MIAQNVTKCGICDSRNLELVLSLGASPPTCMMPAVGVRPATEHHHPLELLRCHDCTLVQLSVIVDPAVMFPPDYPYSSGNSKALHDNFEDLAKLAGNWVGGLKPEDLVLDIGANDGTLLSKFTDCRRIGVEPTMQAHHIDGGPFYRAFFNEALAGQILDEHGKAKVITACNVLAHVKDIGSVMRGIKLLLADDGILIAENHDLASVVDYNQWDTIYHEHLRFYSPRSFDALLETHGLGRQALEVIPTHGGSFRTIARHGAHATESPQREYDFDRLARHAAAARTAIRNDVSGRLWGIGATARATTIINYCGLNTDDVECVCEVPGSDKIGRYIPGTGIPVIDETRLFEERPPRVLLFSWHLADHIVPKLRSGGYHGTVTVPLPQLEHRYSERNWMNKTPAGRFG